MPGAGTASGESTTATSGSSAAAASAEIRPEGGATTGEDESPSEPRVSALAACASATSSSAPWR